ncbi:plasmid mobilization relaxosome protein MobC [Brevundimonas sp. AJA228-03]|uniref:MobC family plasmid mobilization relaxosome protein n=1 Tax=Brevundimonas sp. AJA228-03 TaxID=2752515 RepID=UPI001AE066ED|nr:MobC family plasmid mobilization relaxosome protein [Brevundimonas sp. AJA228-03]QTN20854.1 plasmid mobilization relaxosome protein MobC [Brevundimonas sp. AJA228-03]
MDRLTLRLSPDLIRRFDAAAAGQGGRSRLLRRLMEGAAQASLPAPTEALPAPHSGKLTLRLGEADLRLLEAEAAARGLSRTQWSVALIRRRIHDRPQFSRPETLALIEVRRELRRIGVNVNQIARALNTAVMEGAVLDVEVKQLGAFQTEIAAWVDALGEAFEGNLAYWGPAP